MRKALIVLAMLAAALAAVAAVLVQQPVGHGSIGAAPRNMAAGLSAPYAFLTGFLMGATLMWMAGRRRLAVARARLGWKFSWGRRLAWLGLAVIAAGAWIYA